MLQGIWILETTVIIIREHKGLKWWYMEPTAYYTKYRGYIARTHLNRNGLDVHVLKYVLLYRDLRKVSSKTLIRRALTTTWKCVSCDPVTTGKREQTNGHLYVMLCLDIQTLEEWPPEVCASAKTHTGVGERPPASLALGCLRPCLPSSLRLRRWSPSDCHCPSPRRRRCCLSSDRQCDHYRYRHYHHHYHHHFHSYRRLLSHYHLLHPYWSHLHHRNPDRKQSRISVSIKQPHNRFSGDRPMPVNKCAHTCLFYTWLWACVCMHINKWCKLPSVCVCDLWCGTSSSWIMQEVYSAVSFVLQRFP